jgi:serine protease inhibitor
MLSLLAAALLPLPAGPGGPQRMPPSGCGAGSAGASAAMGAASRAFGLDLTRRLAGSSSAANVVASPLSAQLALAMTAQGTRGATRDAMLRGLGLSPDTDIAHAAALLRTRLDESSCGTLRLANAIWPRQGMTVRPEYRQAIEQGFAGQVTPLDMTSMAAPGTINRWVSHATDGTIPSLVDRLDPGTAIYLTNAAAFEGRWKTPFDPGATQAEPFHRAGADPVPVPLMSRGGKFTYGSGDGYQAVALPYEGGTLRMVVVLPDATLPMSGFGPLMDPDRFTAILGSLHGGRQGQVRLPRFTTDTSLGLTETLRRTPMAPAFGDGADFTGMFAGGEGAHISDVVQKTHLQVDESGTKATAATGVAVVTSARAGAAPEPFDMVVDHPFLVAIEDTVTQALLFSGVIGDPIR